MPEVRRYNGIEEDPDGVYVLYTDAVKMAFDAWMACHTWETDRRLRRKRTNGTTARSEASRRYKEEP